MNYWVSLFWIADEKTEEASSDTGQRLTKNGKKKKSLTWAEDDNLTQVFFFELDEEERGKDLCNYRPGFFHVAKLTTT